MIGVILCGGQSTRMGRDKGLIVKDGKRWAQLASDKVSAQGIEVLISINPHQNNDYAIALPNQKLVPDNSSLNIKGPLLGILSAHLSNQAEDLFILACDLILMDGNLLKVLYESRISNPGFDVLLFNKDGVREPLCGIYTAEGLAKIFRWLSNSELSNFSMKHVLNRLNVLELPLTHEQAQSFTNFNSNEALTKLF